MQHLVAIEEIVRPDLGLSPSCQGGMELLQPHAPDLHAPDQQEDLLRMHVSALQLPSVRRPQLTWTGAHGY